MRVGVQRHAPTTYPRERTGIQYEGDYVGSSPGLDMCGKTRPHRDSICEPSSP